MAKTCAGETNASHPSKHWPKHRHQQTPRNCWPKLVAAIQTQIVTKNSEKWRIFAEKIWLKNHLWQLFGHVWTRFFTLVNFSSTLGTYWIFLGQKNLIDFSPPFTPFFTFRPTPESYNGPLKVLPEGSMVEYLPVGSQEAPQTIIAKKKISSPKS